MDKQNRKVITVDGLAASGKTMLSKLLAEKIGYVQFTTGLLYRAVAYLCLRDNVDPTNSEAVCKLLDQHKIQLLEKNSKSIVEIDDVDSMEQVYKTEGISDAVYKVAALQDLRTALIDHQRHAYPGENIVTEGRDMGTVIFPDADLKFFVEVDTDVKVERRLLQEHPDSANLPDNELKSLKEKIHREIVDRDKSDSVRTLAAKDAIIINNSGQTLTQVVENMYDAVSKAGLF